MMIDIDERKRQEIALAEAQRAAEAAGEAKASLPGQHEPRDPHPDERHAGRAAPAEGRAA